MIHSESVLFNISTGPYFPFLFLSLMVKLASSADILPNLYFCPTLHKKLHCLVKSDSQVPIFLTHETEMTLNDYAQQTSNLEKYGHFSNKYFKYQLQIDISQQWTVLKI